MTDVQEDRSYERAVFSENSLFFLYIIFFQKHSYLTSEK